jgi:hypothetical protein
MSLQQKGRDTDRIDRLYRIHYLQWTGVKSIDRVVGFVGDCLALVLTSLGGWLVLEEGVISLTPILRVFDSGCRRFERKELLMKYLF